MNLKLEKININYLEKLKVVVKEYNEYNEDYEGAFFIKNINENKIKELENASNGILDNPNFVPYTCYVVIDENKEIVGVASIRHYLNDFLNKYGGHIGYSILPTKRNNGYGTKTLKLLLEIAKNMDMKKILITCKNANYASRKVIENNNGIFENEVIYNDDVLMRYRINLD